MENNILFRKVAYEPLVKYENLTFDEKWALGLNSSYLTNRFQNYSPKVRRNWEDFKYKLVKDGIYLT